MTIQTWALFCATEAVLSFIPGPAVLYVVSSSIAHGSRAGVVASLSILAANAFYFILSGTGLGALLLASRTVFIAIKWAGAAYLVYLGLRMVFARSPEAPEAGGERKHAHHAGVFWNGFLTQISNPKAIIFFVALLPQFIDPDESAARTSHALKRGAFTQRPAARHARTYTISTKNSTITELQPRMAICRAADSSGSMNCGSNATKKIIALGFEIWVKKPFQKTPA